MTDLYDAGLDDVTTACFAVAGPILNTERVQLTNLPWCIDVLALLKLRTGLRHIELCNDFAAFAYGIPWVDTAHFIEIKAGQFHTHDMPISAVGPGTGMGVAMMIPDQMKVISCEAVIKPLQRERHCKGASLTAMYKDSRLFLLSMCFLEQDCLRCIVLVLIMI